MKSLVKRYLPHIIMVLVFLALSLAYFAPVLKGYVLPQMDDLHALGASEELREYHKATGEYAQWTNSMFGGMPSYQIYADSDSNVFQGLTRAYGRVLPYGTVAIFFLYLLGFYLLMLSLGAPWSVSAIGAVAFALGSYNLIIIAAGHITKAYAIALMPLVVSGVLRIFRAGSDEGGGDGDGGKRLWPQLVAGGALTTLALGLEVAYNHLQITYYLALALALYYAIELYRTVRSKEWRLFGLRTATLAAATLLSVLPGATALWTTYEYGQYSTRGKSELPGANNGLDKEYALAWSYGIGETPTLLVPNAAGGASQPLGSDLKAVRNADPQIRQAVAQQSAYWGGRSFTSGPVYLGAIVCFLFFIGCFFYHGPLKPWLIGAAIMGLLLAWGKNLPLLTDLLFDYFPLYNKFRTVEMALVITSLAVPTLAMLGLKAVAEFPEDIRYHVGKFFGAVGLTAGVSLVLALAPTLFYKFLSEAEAAQFAQLVTENPLYGQLQDTLVGARAELCRADALRSAMLILLASSALWFASVQRISGKVMLATVALLIAIDQWGVDRRYLNADNFVPKSQARTFQLSPADQTCLDDGEPHRVMALYTSPFNEVYTSYYHHSVGGYHGAKLRRYQDVIDAYLQPEYQRLAQALHNQDYQGLDLALKESPALNMLNTKYLIYNPSQQPLVNHYASADAWFAAAVREAQDPAQALRYIADISDPRQQAIVEGDAWQGALDSLAHIQLTRYSPDRLEYRSSNINDGFAIFSQVYYPAGWRATIDGQETPIEATNYILRGLRVPAGNHDIVFEFRPSSYTYGKRVAAFGSIAVVLLLLGALVMAIKEERK